jgi:hypothetical protein
MKVVTEYQLVKVEYLVNTKNKATAIKLAKVLGDDVAELSNGPVFIETKKYEVRELTSKEKEDKVVKDAINWWATSDKEPEVEPPKKKRGRPKKVVPKDEDDVSELIEMAKGM